MTDKKQDKDFTVKCKGFIHIFYALYALRSLHILSLPVQHTAQYVRKTAGPAAILNYGRWAYSAV